MGEAVFISICVPAYSRVNYLKRLLDSILQQSYRHFEVVITDDSPGNEVQALIDVHSLKPMIRYFKNETSLGTPENWNESIRRASGEWIKLMHDDDWFRDAESLSGFVRVLQERKTDFYFCAYSNVLPDGKEQEIRASGIFLSRLNRNPDILLAANRIGPPSAVLFRNDPEITFDKRFSWLVDFDFYIRYLQKHPPATYIPESLVCIGISGSQVTQTSFGNRAIEIPERFMMWEKIQPGSLNNLLIHDSWWRFIRNLKIKHLEEIRADGYTGQVPLFVASMIEWQNKIPQVLLDRGFSSKVFMAAHYVIRSIL